MDFNVIARHYPWQFGLSALRQTLYAFHWPKVKRREVDFCSSCACVVSSPHFSVELLQSLRFTTHPIFSAGSGSKPNCHCFRVLRDVILSDLCINRLLFASATIWLTLAQSPSRSPQNTCLKTKTSDIQWLHAINKCTLAFGQSIASGFAWNDAFSCLEL